MMGPVRLVVNGREIQADPEKTVLKVVHEQGIDEIPTLCYDDRLPPYGACFLCVVEVKGRRGLVPACSTRVEEGMEVTTRNEKIVDARRTCLELILSDHYADCVGPCRLTCPAGVDVQGYISLIRLGKYREALKLVKETNPLPLVCGRVCVRECELACRRTRVDEPVAVDYLKRYVADLDAGDMCVPEIKPRNGHRVAVVGGGPAGLTCAYFLAREGCSVSIFEAMPKLGGMLRYGIPEYRMPKAILDKEIEHILDLGIEARTGVRLGKDVAIEDLTREGFEAFFLALGAWRATPMRVKGEECEGVLGGIDFLRSLQLQGQSSLRGRVVVVGGGNTAIDSARSSLRLGADEVTILYRRTVNEMPAHPAEIKAAEQEGVNFIFLSAPVRVAAENGRAGGLECIRMSLGEPDASGRRRPEPVPGSEYFLKCDVVISAIGQEADLEGLSNGGSHGTLKIAKGNRLATDPSTLSTSLPGVFAGGDVVTGPATAVEAIAHGRRAALSIMRRLLLDPAACQHEGFYSRRDTFGELPDSLFEDVPRRPRNPMPEIGITERRKTFQEVELGYPEEASARESLRCLECGCNYLYDCRLKEYATQYGVSTLSYLGTVNRLKVDDRHPLIVLNANKCIKCGRCVRTCGEILDVAALGFLYRGFRTVIKPAMDKPLLSTNCIACGNCIEACPTGAITEKLPYPHQGPWPMEQKPSLCTYCSVGCNLRIKYFDRDLFTVSPGNSVAPNNGYLCFRGRFGHFYLRDNKERLHAPMVTENGKLAATSWDKALDRVASGLGQAIRRYGQEGVAVFASPKLSNEELYLLKRLAVSVLKTDQLSSFHDLLLPRELKALDSSFGLTASTNSLGDLDHADVIFVLNSDPISENPIAGFAMKRRAKSGARLLVASSVDLEFNRHAHLWLDSRKRTNTVLLLGIMRQILDSGRANLDFVRSRTEGFDAFCRQLDHVSLDEVSGVTGVSREKIQKAAELLSDPNLSVMVIYNIDSLKENGSHDLQALANLLLLTGKLGKRGNGLVLLREHCNSQGLQDMGIGGHSFPGCEPYSPESVSRYERRWETDLSHLLSMDKKDLRSRLEAGDVKGCLIVGENPMKDPRNAKYLKGVDFLAVQDLYLTETAEQADVVLPLSLLSESTGTFTNCERRIQRFSRVFPARCGLENWEVICQLAGRIGASFRYASPEEVYQEMSGLSPLLKPGEPVTAGLKGRCWQLNGRAGDEDYLFAEGFPLPGGRARFQTFEPSLQVPEFSSAPYCAIDEKLRVFRDRTLMARGEESELERPQQKTFGTDREMV